MRFEKRSFPLGDILSLTTGRVLTTYEAMGDLVDYMVGDSVQGLCASFPIIAGNCAKHVLKQHPQLAEVSDPGTTDKAKIDAWLADKRNQFGERLAILQL